VGEKKEGACDMAPTSAKSQTISSRLLQVLLDLQSAPRSSRVVNDIVIIANMYRDNIDLT
jgi:hypothetical protein